MPGQLAFDELIKRVFTSITFSDDPTKKYRTPSCAVKGGGNTMARRDA